MSSSMLTGERRWVSARRGGMMTVLGKVTVPKPINLPSQRLENQGLDPNVDIVPKGTLSWGGRSTSSSQNAWGSPTDGVCSPSHLSGRPSSGGSGTRPSTAGSDTSHEPSNAWGPNSRPSSASGVLASNQTLVVSTRPQSAEQRPGSSQLSRFAEPVSQSSVAWGSAGAAEKLGTSSSKKSGFALSSGDFPTLGSEKSTESHVNQGHNSQGRPVSASGRVAPAKERSDILSTEEESLNASTERNITTWKETNSPYVGGGPAPVPENWHREPHLYPNHCMPPQHFDPWHGAPVRNPPDGVWYRGPAHVPPYRSPSPPGSYPPNEPYSYYHPQIPARPFANQQPVPRPGSDPTGSYPKQGDPYRQHMPDPYIRPVMPVRPGVYPGPVPYDGYYGPPHAGFHHSNDRDAAMMGMPNGPNFYNRYPDQNFHPDPGNFRPRTGGYGPPTNIPMAKEQVESGHPHDAHRGPYKVILKQHDGKGENDGSREQHMETENQIKNQRENDWVGDHRKHETVNILKISSQSADPSRGGQDSNSVAKAKLVDEGVVKKPETAAILGEGSEQLVSTQKIPTLFEKIEGLNTKVRDIDGRYDTGHGHTREKSHDTGHGLTREEKMKSFRVINPKDDHIIKQAGIFSVSAERSSNISIGANKSGRDNKIGPKSSLVSDSQASAPAVIKISENSRSDYRGKGKVNTEEGEEWRKKIPAKNTETYPDVLDCHTTQEVFEKPDLNLQEKVGEGMCATSALDPSDYNAQRAKMREIATQRAKQLQEEEELRTRHQKAKALAKLEELNRKTLAMERSTQMPDPAPQSAIGNSDAKIWHEVSNSALVSNSVSITQMRDVSTTKPGEPTGLPKKMQSEAPVFGSLDSFSINSMTLPDKTSTVAVKDQTNEPLLHNTSGTKQKLMVHQKKQNKNLSEKIAPSDGTGVPLPKIHAKLAVNLNAPGADDPAAPQQKKKNSRNNKNKHKSNEVDTPSASSMKPIVSETMSAVALCQSAESQKPKDVPLAVDLGWSLPTEEVHSQLKPQPVRKVLRNAHSSRSMEKSEGVVWAPVRSQGNNEASEETTKNIYGIQNHKNRRAEMQRYVPKLARDVSTSVDQAISDKTNIAESGSPSSKNSHLTIGKEVEPRNVDSKRNKYGKMQSSWRQRGSAESSPIVQVPPVPCDEASLSSVRSKIPPKPVEQEKQMKEKLDISNNWKSSNIMPITTEAVNGPVVKEHGVTGGRKWPTHKVNKARGNDFNRSHYDDSHGEISNKADTRPPAFEYHDVSEHVSSHWKPKSPTHNRQASRGNGTERGISHVDNRSGGLPQASKDSKSEVPTVLDEEAKRENFKQGASSMNKPNSSGGLRRHGNNNIRPDRPQEQQPGGISTAGQENSKPANFERPQHNNSHYEYQPVRSHNNKPSESFGEGSSYRGRGQGRRGGRNFHV
ncbi:hypothetical protein GIB67_042775 [Kingdonia uniflora]|uniref:BAT2 N-terminal domain-containing protein n=1 Tax=Kingdonia uniflora TaxID=39325 RepID=A0A7J7L0X8_9MAGN|nr:hypothetical protein GIB67_042775 [Kingdonia uniflora]